jgi:hypothetical protein
MSLVCRLSRRDAVALCALVSAFGGRPVTIHAQTTELDQFVGRDLWKDRLPESEQSRLDRIVGKVPTGNVMEPTPWHVWKTNHKNVTRYIVLLGEPEIIVPGGSSACVLLFDRASKRINNWCFQTGHRITLDSASFDFSTDLGSDLIVLHMVRFANGRNVAKEYFAISSDRLQFVRMENDKGEAAQNEYVFPNHEIGFVPAGHSEDEWVEMLKSADKATILSALVFLGGRHITEPKRPFAAESKYAGLFQQLVGSPRIHDLIVGMSRSNDEWVRQAAMLAVRGPRDRLLE